jgi:MFS family permease
LITLVAAVGGFLFGYDLSLISGAIIFLKEEWNLSPFWVGAVTGSAILGCPFGPLAGAWLADRFGRNKTLIFLSTSSAFRAITQGGIMAFLPLYLAKELGYNPWWVGLSMFVCK